MKWLVETVVRQSALSCVQERGGSVTVLLLDAPPGENVLEGLWKRLSPLGSERSDFLQAGCTCAGAERGFMEDVAESSILCR